MKNYSHPMMDIAYTSERSVQDEVKRMSEGDVITIFISYTIMFAYIALGKCYKEILLDIYIFCLSVCFTVIFILIYML